MAITKKKYYNGDLIRLSDLNEIADAANSASFIPNAEKPFEFLTTIKEVPSASYATCSAWAYWGESPGGCIYAYYENKIYQLQNSNYKSTGSWADITSTIFLNPTAPAPTGSIGYITGSGWTRYRNSSWQAYSGHFQELNDIRVSSLPQTLAERLQTTQSIYSDQYISEFVVGSIYSFRGLDIKYLNKSSTAYVDFSFACGPIPDPFGAGIIPIGDKVSWYMTGSDFPGPMTFHKNGTGPYYGAFLVSSPSGKQTGDGYTVVDSYGLIVSSSLVESYTEEGRTTIALYYETSVSASVEWTGELAEVGAEFTQHTAYGVGDGGYPNIFPTYLSCTLPVSASTEHIYSGGTIYAVYCGGNNTAVLSSTSSAGPWSKGGWIGFFDPPYWAASQLINLTPHPADGVWLYRPRIIDGANLDGEVLSKWKEYPSTYTGSNNMDSFQSASVSCSVMVGKMQPNYPIIKDTHPSASARVKPYGTAFRTGSMILDLQATRCYPYTDTGSLSINVGYLRGGSLVNVSTLNVAEGAISSSRVKIDRVVFDAPYLLHNCSSSVNITARVLGVNPFIGAGSGYGQAPPYSGLITIRDSFFSAYLTDTVKVVEKDIT